MSDGLYTGFVAHKRLRPRAHSLRYRIFMLLLDLDEAPVMARRLRLFGFDGAGLVSLHQRDHGDGSPGGLRAWVEGHLAACGLPCGGKLEILCMPRMLGYAFNPLTLFFCHAPDGGLQAIVYEVNNTFGQRHAYVLAVGDADGTVVQECAKTFHVSPFLPMELQYRFRVLRPDARAGVFITVSDAAGTLLSASFAGARQDVTDAALVRQLLRMPLLGVKILAAIHWQAVLLWLKGLKIYPVPARPRSVPL